MPRYREARTLFKNTVTITRKPAQNRPMHSNNFCIVATPKQTLAAPRFKFTPHYSIQPHSLPATKYLKQPHQQQTHKVPNTNENTKTHFPSRIFFTKSSNTITKQI
jgi:hypothetical protein